MPLLYEEFVLLDKDTWNKYELLFNGNLTSLQKDLMRVIVLENIDGDITKDVLFDRIKNVLDRYDDSKDGIQMKRQVLDQRLVFSDNSNNAQKDRKQKKEVDKETSSEVEGKSKEEAFMHTKEQEPKANEAKTKEKEKGKKKIKVEPKLSKNVLKKKQELHGVRRSPRSIKWHSRKF